VNRHTVLIADPDASSRAMIGRWLLAKGHAVRLFDNVSSALDALAQRQTRARHGEMRKTCLLLDIESRDLNHTLSERGFARTVPVICMSANTTVALVRQALRHGAIDFLEKPLCPDKLDNAMEIAFPVSARGSPAAAPPSSITLADAMAQLRDIEAPVTMSELEHRYETLTPREKEVFRGMVARHSAKNIARDLGIAYKTVEHHWASVLRKMNASTVRELIPMMMNAARTHEPDSSLWAAL
jgi:FixJ family two-component response regulator